MIHVKVLEAGLHIGQEGMQPLELTEINCSRAVNVVDSAWDPVMSLRNAHGL